MADARAGGWPVVRILTLNYEYPPLGGGASPVTRALCEHLAAVGHEVDVVTMGYQHLPQFEISGRVRVIRVPALRRSMVRAETPELLSYIASALLPTLALTQRRRYNVVHAHFIVPTGILAAAVRRVSGLPLVITAHGSDVPGYNPDRFTRGHRLIAPVWRVVAHSADVIVSPSHYLRALIQRTCERPVEVIPYGFDPPPVRISKRKRRILFVSRLFPRKGAHYLLEALAGLPLDGWEITIAGDGPMLEALQAQAQHLGLSVDWRGFIKGAPLDELYASSAIFVFPSTNDNFPVVLLEALAGGCAVITTNISGMPEVVGDAGILVPPQDVPALRDAIRRLMNDDDLRADLSARARARIAHFAWDNVIRRYLEVYQGAGVYGNV
ncbi:glycosyltransferase family 4 protein [Roseiflexus castenholzii]|uniref:glycosyltransferase family 4 protein n=1 Tax=Roseiflexus castenholzii TaxID=120962 RepID=UPI0018DC30D7|nr:glycosyltransferase family 4 protein [Roseiflexus castenholzii]